MSVVIKNKDGLQFTKEEWRHIRVNNIKDEIANMMSKYDPIPVEWVDEYNELVALDIQEDVEPLVINISINDLSDEDIKALFDDDSIREQFVKAVRESANGNQQ